MSRMITVAFAAGVVSVLVVAVAFAQSADEWQGASGGSDQLTLDQSYQGTRPGTGNNLPRVEELKTKPGTWVTWPGFMMRPDGGSRIFLQTTGPIEYTRSDGKKRTTLRLKGAQVHLYNNKHPLVTLFFNTPVKRAYLKRHAKTSDLIVELKVDVECTITQYKDADGYNYLFIDFAPGQYPIGGTFGDRPSFSGYGAPAQVMDDELPAEAVDAE